MRLICINCPKGCEVDVETSGGEVVVKGHFCPRGEAYGRSEATNPVRMVTGLVKVAGSRRPLPVKTRTAIAKGKIAEISSRFGYSEIRTPVFEHTELCECLGKLKLDIRALRFCGGVSCRNYDKEADL